MINDSKKLMPFLFSAMHVNREFLNFALRTKPTNTKFRDDPRRRRSGPASRNYCKFGIIFFLPANLNVVDDVP
jgi:hypothetical protein